ncbi:hypothetical protein EDC01DRAFT_240606 [Geopyxis carbonaria]|nr:hypothetical protein EDC01DRAFT_240606 [Geopyxis carbonaria]
MQTFGADGCVVLLVCPVCMAAYVGVNKQLTAVEGTGLNSLRDIQLNSHPLTPSLNKPALPGLSPHLSSSFYILQALTLLFLCVPSLDTGIPRVKIEHSLYRSRRLHHRQGRKESDTSRNIPCIPETIAPSLT